MMSWPLFYKRHDPIREGKSAHYDPLPDIGDWKFESDFGGDQFRYTNPAYAQFIHIVGPCKQRYWDSPKTWKIVLPGGFYDCGRNGKTRTFKTPERAIKALEADFDPKDS